MKYIRLFSIIVLILCMSGQTSFAQRWAIAANVADVLDLGTIGIEGTVAVGQHWSVNAGVRVNPWTFGKSDTYNGMFTEPSAEQMQNRQQTYSAGLRWWPWNVYSEWWVGCKGQYQEYNRGGVFNPKTQEGDAFGLALSGGYSLMLKKHLNLDFGLGFWGGWTKYTIYACPKCGNVVEKGNKWFVLPNELIFSIVYVF